MDSNFIKNKTVFFKIIKTLIPCLVISITLISCKKDSNSNRNYWTVKYKVTCTNSSTRLNLYYMKEDGNMTWVERASSGWSYEAHYSKNTDSYTARNLWLEISSADPFNGTDILWLYIYVDGKLEESTFNNSTLQYFLN